MNEIETKKLAAVLAALGACRGVLYSVNMGDFNREQIEAMLSSTSLSHLAEALGIQESDLAIDVSQVLSQDVLNKIIPITPC